jgi:hypothetical protein
MRNAILGVIGVLWGGAMLISGVLRGVSGSGSYAAGQVTALGFGVALFAAGGWTLMKRFRAN